MNSKLLYTLTIALIATNGLSAMQKAAVGAGQGSAQTAAGSAGSAGAAPKDLLNDPIVAAILQKKPSELSEESRAKDASDESKGDFKRQAAAQAESTQKSYIQQIRENLSLWEENFQKQYGRPMLTDGSSLLQRFMIDFRNYLADIHWAMPENNQNLIQQLMAQESKDTASLHEKKAPLVKMWSWSLSRKESLALHRFWHNANQPGRGLYKKIFDQIPEEERTRSNINEYVGPVGLEREVNQAKTEVSFL